MRECTISLITAQAGIQGQRQLQGLSGLFKQLQMSSRSSAFLAFLLNYWSCNDRRACLHTILRIHLPIILAHSAATHVSGCDPGLCRMLVSATPESSGIELRSSAYWPHSCLPMKWVRNIGFTLACMSVRYSALACEYCRQDLDELPRLLSPKQETARRYVWHTCGSKT